MGFEYTRGTLNRALNGKTKKDTKLKIFKVAGTLNLMYKRETWVSTRIRQLKLDFF